MRNLLTKNRSGFTLVELLIVVAILGVLATVGVPAYRQMIQKSKKAEAKVNLGNVSLVESAFFSEFGGYGNNLAGMGFEMDAANPVYVIGFAGANCAAAGTTLPDQTDAIGKAVVLSSPAYYNISGTNPPQYKFGRQTFTSCPATALTRVCNDGTNPPIDVALPINVANGNVYNQSDCTIAPVAGGLHSQYVAIAAGCIRQGQNPDTCGVLANADHWTMNHARSMQNIQDGVK